MTNKRRIAALALLGLAVATILIIGGAVASVYAYRQLVGDDSLQRSQGLLGRQVDRGQALDEKGVLILRVDPDGPAAAAGLRRGSVILSIDGQEVNTPQELRQVIRSHDAGETVILSVLNCDQPEDIEVTLDSAGPYLGVDIGGGSRVDLRGFEFDREDMPPESLVPPIPHDRLLPGEIPELPRPFHAGVAIFSVVPDSPAEEIGLRAGDFITAVDGQPVGNRSELADLIGQKSPGDDVELTVLRLGAETLTLTASLASHPDDAARGFLGVNLVPTEPSREFSGPPKRQG